MVDPCIPSAWPEYRISWRFQSSRYEITVTNPLRRCRGVATATLDGAGVDPRAIPLLDDGRTHDATDTTPGAEPGPTRISLTEWRLAARLVFRF